MRHFYAIVLLLLIVPACAIGQETIRGTVVNQLTKEPIPGAAIRCGASCGCGCIADDQGRFELVPRNACCTSFEISSVGFESVSLTTESLITVINLNPVHASLQEVLVTANREGVRRSQAPIAISSISTRMIQETKPVTIDQVLNKVSGVYMVNLGNEQHSMSIRQPMTTKSLFLYLEDGIPVRTTGLFNHNALLEMNMANVKSIEVIKGPSSSLYGSEAIGGVVNFITQSPPDTFSGRVSMQANNIGYKRAELQAGFRDGKWGFNLGGYYADKRNGYIDYSDFHKAVVTIRAEYKASEKATWDNSLTLLDYYSQMAGSIDSTAFADRVFKSNQTFTYRKVKTLRYRSVWNQHWSDKSKTTASVIFRHNVIGQNPAYSVKDDYRRTNGGIWTGQKDLAHGEINEAGFNSYALILQHRQRLSWKKAVIVAGASLDVSPAYYTAEYISITKDTVTKKYPDYSTQDSILTNYDNRIDNFAAFVNLEMSPARKLRLVASLRYDLFRYSFDNHLAPSSFSGAPDTVNHFRRLSPKIGMTYNFSNRIGAYANYSQGFVPPQVTEMYKGVKIPELRPSVFHNYEIGGWADIVTGKLKADISVYQLEGTNEIISVRMDDGSSQNMNAGKTRHRGIEFGLSAQALPSVQLRFSSALSEHLFVEFIEKGNNYNGYEMNNAPRWMHNAEVWYRPEFLNGFRVGLEWQRLGSYYMDPRNTARYKGHDVFHLRTTYKFKQMECWIHLVNITDKYYAYTSSKSNSGYSYSPAEPRHITVGLTYDLTNVIK